MKTYSLVFPVLERHGEGMPPRDRLLAAVVAVLWGANFLAIHVGLQHFPPLFLAALRFAVIALPTVLFVPRPQVRLRWLLGYGLGFGTLQFLFLFVAMDVGMPTGLASLVLQASAPRTTVNGADACNTSDASPVGIPTSIATNRNRNCSVPNPSP